MTRIPVTDIHDERILILDFGSQYTQLIARRVREAGVYSEVHPWDWDDTSVRDFAPKGIILSGGPESVLSPQPPQVAEAVLALGVPVLGVCYGMQTLAAQLGGQVASAERREFGYAVVRARGHSALLRGIEDRRTEEGYGLLDVWMSHGDRVERLPPGFKVIASSDASPLAGMADESRSLYGLQFHPEVTHTTQGGRILARFVLEICGCSGAWTAGAIIDDAVTRIRAQVNSDAVILGLSGGVDSAVTAALLSRAIGQQLTALFVDNGLLRLGEADEVMAAMGELGVAVRQIDARARFLGALTDVSDPEAKRKCIGRVFIEVFEEAARECADAQWLAQGTIYPDVIESAGASGTAHVIKSHHNVGGLPERMRLGLVEPLRELFKDEVRRVGLALGLPASLIGRHPFPGPGLAVRVLGALDASALTRLRAADRIFIDELRAAGWYDRVAQAFAVFLPVRSVGVMGDGRRYENVIALRAVETVDFMTAGWAPLPYDLLDHVSRRIINEVDGISRVTYDISGKPPATIEWE